MLIIPLIHRLLDYEQVGFIPQKDASALDKFNLLFSV